jgi:O-antigen ligase
MVFVLLRKSASDTKSMFFTTGTVVLTAISGLSLLIFAGQAIGLFPKEVYLGVGSDFRLLGLSLEPNLFAGQVVGWLSLLYARRRQIRRPPWVSVPILLSAALLASTRTAWLALLAVGIVALAERSGRKLVVVAAAVLIPVALLLITLPQEGPGGVTDDSFAYRLEHILDTQGGTGAYRLGIYEQSIRDIDTVPRALFGTGMNTFSQFHPVDETHTGSAYLSSLWYATLYDTGAVGLVCLLALMASIVAASRSRRDAIAVMIAFLICASATNSAWLTYPWVILALIPAIGSDDLAPPSANDDVAEPPASLNVEVRS